MRLIARRLTLAATYFLIGCVLLLGTVTFKGVSDAGNVAPRDSMYKVLAYFYPNKTPISSLVLLDELTASQGGENILTTHARVLRAVARRKPSHILIDYYMVDEKGKNGIEDFVQALREIKSSGIRLYMGAMTPTARPERGPIIPELRSLVDDRTLELVSLEVGRDTYDQPVYRKKSEFETLGTRRFIDTAAIRLIRDLRPDIDVDRLPDEIELWWPLPPAEFNCAAAQRKCPAETYGLIRQLLSALKQPFKDIEDPIPFLFTPVIYSNYLFNGRLDLRDKIEETIKGKIVIYGRWVDQEQDVFRNPIYAIDTGYRNRQRHLVPGSFYHAIAIQNINDLSYDVKIPANENEWISKATTLVIFILSMSSSIILVWMLTIKIDIRSLGFAGEIALDAGILIIILFINIGIASIMFFRFNIGSTSWLDIFATTAIPAIFFRRELLFEKLKDTMDQMGGR